MSADLGQPDDLMILSDKPVGFSNGAWNRDRNRDAKQLVAGTTVVVADIEGPGVIRQIHSTRHFPTEIFARGIVLEIRFDDAEEPAVLCPLADFFGDGCNGAGVNFTTPLIECAPGSYNCYIPMPFRKRAQVLLRNDTDRNATNYSYVEWERLPEWNPCYGYFHATFARRSFRLTRDTDITFFEIRGRGQFLGRQYSIVTDEPTFNNFEYVMEGNNEVDIDGQARVLDYLGSEDSFTFSWGFQEPFSGLRAGMPFIDKGKPHRLSLYRFHDHMPIPFEKQLRWHINWSTEWAFHDDGPWVEQHDEALARDGCWVDYQTVHYWYQDVPGGFTHEPLPNAETRRQPMLR